MFLLVIEIQNSGSLEYKRGGGGGGGGDMGSCRLQKKVSCSFSEFSQTLTCVRLDDSMETQTIQQIYLCVNLQSGIVPVKVKPVRVCLSLLRKPVYNRYTRRCWWLGKYDPVSWIDQKWELLETYLYCRLYQLTFILTSEMEIGMNLARNKYFEDVGNFSFLCERVKNLWVVGMSLLTNMDWRCTVM